MEKKIFIAATEQRSGKSLLTIGLMSALQGIVPAVGYMKPIGQRYRGQSDVDEDALLVKEIFSLHDALADINPASLEAARADKDLLFERIFGAYARLSAGKDVVVIEGTDYTSTVAALEFDINAELAQNLAAPVLLVANGAGKSSEEIVRNVAECRDSFRDLGCRLLGAVVNRYQARGKADTGLLEKQLADRDIPLFGVLPGNPLLSGPRLREVADKLGAKILSRGDDLSKIVTRTLVLAMTPENALGYMKERDGCLLVTPGDRVEHILASLSAQKSSRYPSFSGLVLTGGLTPGKNVRELIHGLADVDLTILSVPDDTYSAALRVSSISGELDAGDREKIDLACGMVEKCVRIREIHAQLGAIPVGVTTPRMFQYRILEMARADRRHIVLPEGEEPRIIRAAAEVLRKEICDLTLLGDAARIREAARGLGADIRAARLLDPARVPERRQAAYAGEFYRLRKYKGVTREMARDALLDPVNYAAMMVRRGDADGFVSGAVHSTADTLAPVLRIIGARRDVALASSVFFMCLPDRVLVYGDCALVEDPSAEEMADIAVTSADTARAFGIDPVVALLSYSTGSSGRGRGVDKVREATRIAREKRPGLPIEGPIQYDAAASLEVARVKLKESRVAGIATVYIFPSLDAGNTAYKAVQQSANILAIGPVLQGLNRPANDLSRGATVADIVYTIAATAVQAGQPQQP
jgi:phosphate acetyltransferase